jgi:hypothetical protein
MFFERKKCVGETTHSIRGDATRVVTIGPNRWQEVGIAEIPPLSSTRRDGDFRKIGRM